MPTNQLHLWLPERTQQLADRPLRYLQLDSRNVSRDDVFIALPGTREHGNQYINQALAQGAALVLTDSGSYQDERVLVISDLVAQMPALAARFYHQPQKQLQLVGVTGTNGKSSTCCYINQLAGQCATPAAVVGTLGYGHWQQLTPLLNTTPHYIDLQRILSELLQQKTELVAMEVSSHALVQQRVAGLQFQVAVFTNLSRDHLDYHGSMAEYGQAKSLLFQPDMSRCAVLNVSDPLGKALASRHDIPVWAYGKAEDCQGQPRFLGYHQLTAYEQGYRCLLSSHAGEHELHLPLLGEFNVQNALAAISSLLALGYDLTALLHAAGHLQPLAGRMEQFPFSHGVTVVVDYAHTPDALQQALQALRQHCGGRLWCVFGCGGDRDKGKRPIMGQLAQQYADHCIVTSDNPRSENPLQICQDIAAGMQSTDNYRLEPNRQLAIKLALVSAQPGDVILLAGKGHETTQIIGHEQQHYDERAYVRQLMSEMAS
ncbi:UDP-N-acetylmuramyl peptide synthase [Arsukibacterium ikkense]|uniref:UDP-N-acetylmuramoyl-L-alanyl-D-glutamate--2,6-diaminopimelate ligase n=1 Tax=Arsukibacterium ikkense TaxID=336831 RepID=A0A0M2V2F8_9GAMM|nr:UDP-N-acetylmuramoyl-L-alanyl-D-glutamate--2,6-diaminopimelate ligase [Arsukibacterium ikkense]KKO45042.1 UDP-N-acetylmuramyl peptide synthase [Arsukibacterium ikkense]